MADPVPPQAQFSLVVMDALPDTVRRLLDDPEERNKFAEGLRSGLHDMKALGYNTLRGIAKEARTELYASLKEMSGRQLLSVTKQMLMQVQCVCVRVCMCVRVSGPGLRCSLRCRT